MIDKIAPSASEFPSFLLSQPPTKLTTPILPSLSPSVAPTYYGGSSTGIVESLDVKPSCT